MVRDCRMVWLTLFLPKGMMYLNAIPITSPLGFATVILPLLLNVAVPNRLMLYLK